MNRLWPKRPLYPLGIIAFAICMAGALVDSDTDIANGVSLPAFIALVICGVWV